MYRRTTKHRTNVNERHNALNASDHQAFEILQAVMLYTFVQHQHAHQLLLASVTLDLHEDEDDTIFFMCLLNYYSKTRLVRVVHTIDFFINLPRTEGASSPSNSGQPNFCVVRSFLVLPLHQVYQSSAAATIRAAKSSSTFHYMKQKMPLLF
jgi:hypothetical protein